LSETQGNVAACDIAAKTVYIHPYFFTLTESKQLEILYHELISHIGKGIANEDEAMRDTEEFYEKISPKENEASTRLVIKLPLFALPDLDLVRYYIEELKPLGINTISLLPLTEPIEDSPYAPVSSYALNGEDIDLKEDYSLVLKQDTQQRKSFEDFTKENAFWLDEYAEFMAMRQIDGSVPQAFWLKEKVFSIKQDERFDEYVLQYKYIQWVRYNELKAALDAIHKHGGKVLFDYPMFRAKLSAERFYHPEYFIDRSPGIYDQNWDDLALWNWKVLKKDNYEFIINPVVHWLKFGFDGLRIDAIHFAYDMKTSQNNARLSGDEPGDEYLGKLKAKIQGAKSDAIVVAEAFEGTAGHINEMFGFTTIENLTWYSPGVIVKDNVWLEIGSHDSLLPYQERNYRDRFGVTRDKESYIRLLEEALRSGAKYVCFTIGFQWGDDSGIKTVDENGKSHWTYRMPVKDDRKRRPFDISEDIAPIASTIIPRKAIRKNTYNQGYQEGLNILIPDNKIVREGLGRLVNFELRSDQGKNTLYNIVGPSLYSLLIAYEYMKFTGEKGEWSLAYHSHNGDFFKFVRYILKDMLKLSDNEWPVGWGYIKGLEERSKSAFNTEESILCNLELFGFVRGVMEGLSQDIYIAEFGKRELSVDTSERRIFRSLLSAVNSFVVKEEGVAKILAGYPWFINSWGRDVFISLPGVLLVTGRFREAKEVFGYFAKYLKNGLIPNYINSDGSVAYNSVDASLWFIEALCRYYKSTMDKEFISKMLPVVKDILNAYTKGTGYGIHRDLDGLIATSEKQLTWMDAAPGGNTSVTPRNGKAVEIQALYYNAQRILSQFESILGNEGESRKWEGLAEGTKSGIMTKLWNKQTGYPYDVIEGDSHSDAIRPNALLLISLSHNSDLLNLELQEKILQTVDSELLTPYGLRTLSPRDKKYKGKYDTFVRQEIKDQAYHQGTVWPWLVGPYIDALVKIRTQEGKNFAQIQEEVRGKLNPLLKIVSERGMLPEVFSGDAPYAPGGTVSQAWSLAEILRIFDEVFLKSKLLALDGGNSQKQEQVINLEEITDLWRILVEKELIADVLTVGQSSADIDRSVSFKKAIFKAVNEPLVKNVFVTQHINRLRTKQGLYDVKNLRKGAGTAWYLAKGKIIKFEDVYFEDSVICVIYSADDKQLLVRIAPDYFVDYLTDTTKIRSFFGGGLRVDVITDSQEIADIRRDLELYRSNPELYKTVNQLNSSDIYTVLKAMERLKRFLRRPELKEEAERLLTAALGIENPAIQRIAQEILNNVYSARPMVFPAAKQTRIAKLGEHLQVEDVDIEVGFNPIKDKEKLEHFKAQLAVAATYLKSNRYYDLEALALTDNSVRLSVSKIADAIEAKGGVIHLAVRFKQSDSSRWQYSETDSVNIAVFCQKDIRGTMIYQTWPAYLGVYNNDGKVCYDEKGRAIPGKFRGIEKLLPHLWKMGYRYVYVMGVFQLDKPENIIGQVGPDASIFSPLRFTISEELGGEAGFKKLLESARYWGIEVLVDIVPHVNQNFKDFPEWAYVKAKHAGMVLRRLATDGSVSHEDGSPVEWHDSVMLNWRDKRVLDAFADVIRRLATMGVRGVRVDVAHNFGVMLPVDTSLGLKQRLFGQVTSWDRNIQGGFKVINDWDNNEANPLLVYLVSLITKEYPDFVFIGENYQKYIQIIKSGIVPMDSGTHDDLEKAIIKETSTQAVLNGHFRWLFSELPAGAQLVSALETHDYYRLMDRWQSYGPEKIKAAILIWLATTRGAISIYNRQEIGEVHRIRIDNYTYHNYIEADRQRYYAQLDFERIHGETVQKFYERMFEFYNGHECLRTGENYILDTNNDRVFAIARYNQRENLIFVINCGWQTAYTELDLASLLEKLKIKSSRENFYRIKDHETGREEIFTGEELTLEGLKVRLSSYKAAVISIEEATYIFKVADDILIPALQDALLRYHTQNKDIRTKANFAFVWLAQAIFYADTKLFFNRFTQLASLVKSNGKIGVSDLTVMMHEIFEKHTERQNWIKETLSSLSSQAEDKFLRDAAYKVRRWIEVGVVVFVSPEATPLSKCGGMANVVGELAEVLAESGLKVYIVTPIYKYDEKYMNNGYVERGYTKDRTINSFNISYSGKVAQVYLGRHGATPAALAAAKIKKVHYIVLDNPHFADALYGHLRGDTTDNAQKVTKEHELLRSIFLSLGALEAMK
ncbi:MAG: 4-alpha-glucanotransferase, partial [Candidatus Omnitrophica bacterium]|nr:4-alpha-glucanotransferase [Candidatus Omnitrophota bacterium]